MTNGRADEFNEALRIDADARKLLWEIVPEAHKAGGDAEAEHASAKGELPNGSRWEKRRRPEELLRVADLGKHPT